MKLHRAITFSLLGLCASFLLSPADALYAQDLKGLLELGGNWRFHLGDDPRWGTRNFDDRAWSTIDVPGAWENQGYPGYDGLAWYRTTFTPPLDWRGKALYLLLGQIDDVDEVYLNGQLIGASGSFPPAYVTAYDLGRAYPIPDGVLEPGVANTIAVRVYDSQLAGGIVQGPVRISEDRTALRPDESLRGIWKFATGDDPEWKMPSFDDSGWKPILVPGFWEKQGYKDYDGIGWYRIRFKVGATSSARDMILMLGKIDDVDETYLNGQLVGRTGWFFKTNNQGRYGQEYNQIRAYTIPAGTLRPDRENVLAIRVHDSWRDGGIYQGPIGIVTREKYKAWTRQSTRRRVENPDDIGRIIKEFFEDLFR